MKTLTITILVLTIVIYGLSYIKQAEKAGEAMKKYSNASIEMVQYMDQN